MRPPCTQQTRIGPLRPARSEDRERYAVDERTLPQIDRMFRSLVTEDKARYYVYGILEHGCLIHTGSFGDPETLGDAHRRTGDRGPATANRTQRVMEEEGEDSVGTCNGDDLSFRIASMSKSFTAAAILRLVWQSRLRLDDPIADIVPAFANIRSFGNDALPVTVADLLAMRSGLPEDDAWADRQESMAHDEFLALFDGGLHTVFPTGVRYEYSNIGYAMLGEIIRVVSGRDPADCIQTEIMEPLGLSHTVYDYRKVDPQLLVRGHHRNVHGHWAAETFTAPGAFSPIGGVISTLRDMARWVAWLDGDESDAIASDQVLPYAYRRLMQIGHTPIPPVIRSGSSRGRLTIPEETSIESYGYGLVIEHHPKFGDIIHHSGGYPGYGSDMRWHPVSGIGMIVLADGRYATPSVVASRALHVLLASTHPVGKDHCGGGMGAPARQIRLWPQTRSAMICISRALCSASEAGGTTQACRDAMRTMSPLFAMNVVLDDPLENRSERLHNVFAETGPIILSSSTRESDPDGMRVDPGPLDVTGVPSAAERSEQSSSPAQLTWTMPCAVHPLRCSIRLNPLDPPRIDELEFAVADQPSDDDVTVTSETMHIVG